MNSNSDWTLEDLDKWHEKIISEVERRGLACFSQEFEICDFDQMIGYMAYSGMPSHYPHWSYGKANEKIRTLYEYGMTGLPYEMVINSNPAIAYLMKGNSLLLQILTMAHVYGHNDFFRNNATFSFFDSRLTVETFKVHADRIRAYERDPSIGEKKVENILDAAHALSLQCRRNFMVKKLTKAEQEKRVEEKFVKPRDEYELKGLHRKPELNEEGLTRALEKNPLESEEDILLFVADNNKRMQEWERDILRIAHEEAQYFIPQVETRIMNEGWASFWHKRILEKLDLPQGMRIEFMARHSQVLAPHPGELNPYHLGFKVWEAIDIYDRGSRDIGLLDRDAGEHILYAELKHDFEERGASFPVAKPRAGKITVENGDEAVFAVREADRDASFLRRFLTPPLMRRLGLFEYERKDNKITISNVSGDEGWKAVKETLIRNVGMGSIPVIKVEDADYGGKASHLLLKHYHDGRDLHLEYAEKTLGYVKKLWNGHVTLETVLNGKPTQCFVDSAGNFRTDSIK